MTLDKPKKKNPCTCYVASDDLIIKNRLLKLALKKKKRKKNPVGIYTYP